MSSVWLISLSLMFSRFIHFTAHKVIAFLFVIEYYFTVCVYIPFRLSVHPLIDTQILSTFWLLWIMLLGVFPGSPVVKNPSSVQGTQVQSLVRDAAEQRRSHVPQLRVDAVE